MAKTCKRILSIAIVVIMIFSLSTVALATSNESFVVKKVWSGGPTTYPDVTLTLYKDGVAQSTATPSPNKNENVWIYTYSNLESGHAYSVTETPIANYTTTYEDATPNSVGTPTRVTTCKTITFNIPDDAFIVVKLTANNGYLVWTKSALTTDTQKSDFRTAFNSAHVDGFGPLISSNTTYISGSGVSSYGASVTVNGNQISLTFDHQHNWTMYAHGDYTLGTPFTITNTYVPPEYNVSYTDGTNTYNAGSRTEGTNYTVLAFSTATGLSAPSHMHFIGWTAPTSVSTTIGATVAQPPVDVLYTAQFENDPTYTVTYQFTGSTPTPEPALPIDGNAYYFNELVDVAGGYSNVYDPANHITWVFNGWDHSDFNIQANTLITGTWRNVPDGTYVVTYIFDGPAPDSSLAPLPVDSNAYFINDPVDVDDGYNPIDDSVNHGTWYFNGWDKSDFNITANTLITGTWRFEADQIPEYGVTYNYVAASGTLPTEISTTSGAYAVSDPDTYQAGISVDLVSTAPAIGTVFNTSGGIWTLTSWSTHPLNMTVEGIAFTGTWTFREYELPPPPPPPQRGRELGSLTVTKTISGDVDEAPDDTFDFTVTFAPGAPDYWNILGISVPEGAIGSNGVFTFSLKADQSMTFSNIPVGTTYTVVETSDLPDGWTAGTQTDATGSIDANGATAIIDNIYEVTGVLGDSDTEDDPNEDAAVAGDSDVLPQTGGVSAATLLGIAGIMLLGSGLAVAIIGRKKKEE